jgi:hypothetical protein
MMTRETASLLLGVISVLASAISATQAELLTPDWGAPATARYLNARTQGGRGVPWAESLERPGRSFSLPVLGLAPDFQHPDPPPATRERFIGGAAPPVRPQWWPACAQPTPTVSRADDASGTWYTFNYDFGCIHVTITGDRNSASEVPAGLSVDLAEKRGDSRSATDENNEPDKTFMRSHDIRRFNIPYSVSIECTEGSLAFCRDEAAQKVLLARLSIVDGAPSP